MDNRTIPKGIRNKKGSALLIAVVLMGILMTLSVGVSNILIRTMVDSRTLLEKTQAWYAAESAAEHALKDIAENPPGFETTHQDVEVAPRTTYSYAIDAVAKQIPVRQPHELRFGPDGEDTFDDLTLNQSVTIPLFRSTEENSDVKRFKVDYYLSPSIALRNGFVSADLDILRWKIFGRAADGSIEVLNEFVPADRGSAAQTPTCMGTENGGCYNGATFYRKVIGSDGQQEYVIEDRYPISQFLQDHTQNYLVLTNFVNVGLISGSLSTADKMKLAIIKYRIIEMEGEERLTLPVAKVTADGTVGTTKQHIDLNVPQKTFLPVFNFALYRTAD